ncbi:MAG TPA: hypothetical protein ENI89_00115 [Desulfobulbus sp.]|nr:hypothetical protein [Desulfobulbus sp.]
MKRTSLLTAFFALPLFLLLLPAPAPGQESCVELLKAKCLRCHYETRICRKLEQKASARAWNGTIGAMIRHGANVSKEERKQLASCLAGREKEVLEFCGQN